MVDDVRGIVTPEAVVLEFETAGVGSRLVPVLLDVFLQISVLGILATALAMVVGALGLPTTVIVVTMILLAFVVIVGYPVVAETVWNGRTLGKAAFGLRVVTREGAPVRFRHSAIRGIVRVFEILIMLGAPAVLSATLTRDNQRLGDLAAGTIVIRDRTGDGPAQVATFPPPPGYEPYVASLDVSGLTAEQYGVIRSFLLRATQLTVEARTILAVRLANPVALRLSHTPPPMLNPELFLASVASAYQLRHGGGYVVPYQPAQAWAANQVAGGWTGTAPAWRGAGPMSGPSTVPPPPGPPPVPPPVPPVGGTRAPQ
jgi:uncharacterized RDD family membrane protein YckC